ncbi:MAG: response regulator [Spirochaetota bacterium]
MSRKILLVEDEAIIALSEAQMLERHGYAVVIVHSGQAAVEAMDTQPEISLVLMDIDLGRGMDGTEAAESILERHDLPIVFLSSHTESEVVEKTEGITSYGYIVKNSGETVLLASIRMAFRLYEAHRRLAGGASLHEDRGHRSQLPGRRFLPVLAGAAEGYLGPVRDHAPA